MTPSFHASSISILVACILSLVASQGAFADGRRDWQGYPRQSIDLMDSRPVDTQLTCPPYHRKWDWRGNQWVDIAVTIDLASGQLQLSQQFTDRDSYDDDFVCVTTVVVDAAGANLVAHHQNWWMEHGEVVGTISPMPPAGLPTPRGSMSAPSSATKGTTRATMSMPPCSPESCTEPVPLSAWPAWLILSESNR